LRVKLRILAALAIVYHLLLALRPDDRLMSRPLLEDAFYALGVSRSIGHGLGFTVDGIHPTNGVQPLICLLYAPLFTVAGENTFLALRLVMLLQVACFAAAAFAAAGWWRMLRRDRSGADVEYWTIATLFLWNYSLLTWILNGLETGLALALVFASATWYQRRIAEADSPAFGECALLGVMLGLGVLARIDVAIFVPMLLFHHLLQSHLRNRHRRGAERWQALGQVVLQSLSIGGIAVAVSAPWWIYNVGTFGSLLPISGQAQQMLNPDRIENLIATASVISDALMLNAHLPLAVQERFWYLGILAAVVLLLAVSALPASRRYLSRIGREWSGEFQWQRAIPVALFAAALLIYYSFFFGAPHFQGRYLIIVRVMIFMAMVSLFHALFTRSPRARMILTLAFGVYLATSAYWLSRSFTWSATDGNLFLVPAEWIARNVSKEERVGMFQSGTTGFLSPNVENLDGKVNARALQANIRGEIARYVDSAAFDYIIDWDMFTRPLFSNPVVGRHYTPVDTLPYGFVVWKRVR
jgi:hypothetical protein